MDINLKIDQLEKIIVQQNQILEQQKFILEYMPVPECVDIKYICSKLKISRPTVYSSPWLLPNFGKPDYPSSTKRWKWDNWIQWQSRDEKERRSEWLSLPVKTKEEIMGVKK